jgi:hypothetical protein
VAKVSERKARKRKRVFSRGKRKVSRKVMMEPSPRRKVLAHIIAMSAIAGTLLGQNLHSRNMSSFMRKGETSDVPIRVAMEFSKTKIS